MKAYPAYKETEIQWVGMVPSHWIKHRISQLLEIVSEIGNSADELLSVYLDRGVIKHSESNGMQVHKPSKDMSSYQRVEIGDLVCNNQQAWRGSVGISPHKGRISPAYIIFRLSCLLCPEYANYFFRSQAWNPAFVLSSKGVGSIQRNLYIPWLKQHSCYLPSIQEQNAIVSYLDKKCAEIDELMTRRQAIIERLKELKQSIIAEAVTKGLNPDVPMKDSGTAWQSKVPAHWNKLRHKNVLYPKVSYIGDNTEKLPMLSLTKKGVIVRDVSSGKGKFSADESKFLVVEPGDFVFCHYDIQETPRTVGLSNYRGYITGSYNVYGYKGYNRHFFYYLHEYIDDRKLLCPLYKGLRNTIREDRFLAMRIFLPPENEQKAIVSYLDKKCAEIDTLISRQEQIIEKLKELKTSTIAHVVTGKVDVRDTL